MFGKTSFALIAASVAMTAFVPAHAGIVSKTTKLEAPCQEAGVWKSNDACIVTTVDFDGNAPVESVTLNGSATQRLKNHTENYAAVYLFTMKKGGDNNGGGLTFSGPNGSSGFTDVDQGKYTRVVMYTADNGASFSDASAQ